MADFIKELCAPHFWAILLTIGLMLLLLGAGVAIRPLLKKLLDAGINRLSGGRVEVNVIGEGGEVSGKQKEMCKTCGIVTDIPKNCPFHEAEHERSKRNEEEINKLWQNQSAIRTEIMTKLDAIEKGNRQIILALAKAGRLRPGDFDSDGG